MGDFFLYDEGNILNKRSPLADKTIDDIKESIRRYEIQVTMVESLQADLNFEYEGLKLKLNRMELEQSILQRKVDEFEHRSGLQMDELAQKTRTAENVQHYRERIQEIIEGKPEVKREIKEKKQDIKENLDRKREVKSCIEEAKLQIEEKMCFLPESNRRASAIEVTNRTTFKRLPNPDTVVQINRDQFMSIWNKVWNRLNIGNESNIFSEVDVAEVKEADIQSGKILSMDGRIYREVEVVPFGETETDTAITNVKNSDYYVKLADGNVVGYNSRKRFLFYLQNIFAGLNAEREFFDDEPDVQLMSELVIIIPKVVKNLPLYIFNSTKLVNVLENSLVKAFAKLQNDDKYASYDKEVVNTYIRETLEFFEQRKKEAKEARIKR